MADCKIAYNYDEVGVPSSFNELVMSCTLAEKKAMLVTLRNSIKIDLAKRTTRNINFNQYVEVVHDFLPTDYLDDVIKAEVHSLGLITKSNKPQTQWLSCDTREYCFSDNDKSKHMARDINQFPGICDLLKRVNSDPRTSQNADTVYNNSNA